MVAPPAPRSQAIWERCLTNQETVLTKGVVPPVLKPRLLAESPNPSPTKRDSLNSLT